MYGSVGASSASQPSEAASSGAVVYGGKRGVGDGELVDVNFVESLREPGRQHLFVDEEEHVSPIFLVCNGALPWRSIVAFLSLIGMGLFFVAVSINKATTVGCKGLDCVFSSSGSTKSINTTSSTTPKQPPYP
jgi:hypothetical protein